MMFARINRIEASKSLNLKELASEAGVDPKFFYWDANFSGVDIRGQDLTGLQLENAAFDGVIANASTRVDREFRRKVFGALLRSRDVNWRTLSSDALVEHAVILARAGEAGQAEEIVSRLLDGATFLPRHSTNLMLCEEISAKLRNRYYKVWWNQFAMSTDIATFIALLAYNNDLKSAATDNLQYLSQFDDVDLDVCSTDDCVTTVIGSDKMLRGAIEAVSKWFRNHISGPKVVRVYEYLFHFGAWKHPDIAHEFSNFIEANQRDRRIGELILRGLRYFGNNHAVVARSAAVWLSRNMRAEYSRDVLAQVMRLSVGWLGAGSLFLRWTRINDWRSDDDDELTSIAEAYLFANDQKANTRTKKTIRARLKLSD